MKKYDYLIVGAGLFGATFAYLANKKDKRCLVIDKRPHLGGNLYCENINNINVHKYGAHIFHTSNKAVWNFVNSIVEFNRFTNSPIANYKGNLYNLPFNMNTFYQMWGVSTPESAKKIIEEQKAKALEKMNKEGVTEPRNLEEQAQILIGIDIYEKLIKGYTEKQWGRSCKDLPSFIIRRLPVRFVYDNNYFNDNYQGIPIGGYNKLIDGLLKGIETITNFNFFTTNAQVINENPHNNNFPLRKCWHDLANRLVYCGPIDEFFDYKLGKLEYRTVRFETVVLKTNNYQGNAVVNYTDKETPYTRIIEHKHFESFGEEVDNNPYTVISKEYSCEWSDGLEPYYPINNIRNSELAEKYRILSQKEENVIFGGRLAEYKYYDMAPIIEKVLNMNHII